LKKLLAGYKILISTTAFASNFEILKFGNWPKTFVKYYTSLYVQFPVEQAPSLLNFGEYRVSYGLFLTL